jgi:hypothetical protein
MAKSTDGPRAEELDLPLIGRREELKELGRALRDRRSRLILGSPGAGKSRLIQEATLAEGMACVTLLRPRQLHQLLVDCAKKLNCRVRRFPSIDRATTIALKPLIVDSLQHTPRCVVVEDIVAANPGMYRFLQELYHVPGVSLIISATSRSNLGFLQRLFWDPREEISLGPLNRSDAQCLFDQAADRFQIQEMNVEDFRSKVLTAARGNPGQIVSMCRFAIRPEYHVGRYIKFLPLRIDVLISMCHE